LRSTQPGRRYSRVPIPSSTSSNHSAHETLLSNNAPASKHAVAGRSRVRPESVRSQHVLVHNCSLAQSLARARAHITFIQSSITDERTITRQDCGQRLLPGKAKIMSSSRNVRRRQPADFTANKVNQHRTNDKVGRLIPTGRRQTSTLSIHVPRFLTAITPSGMAMDTAISIATNGHA